jgi:hypothetical protein
MLKLQEYEILVCTGVDGKNADDQSCGQERMNLKDIL